MVKKNRISLSPSAQSQPLTSRGKVAAGGEIAGLPEEVTRGDHTVTILVLMVFLAPAVGVPYEEMLQDTLKSMLVSFAALAAGLQFFLHQKNRVEPLRWHAVMWLP